MKQHFNKGRKRPDLSERNRQRKGVFKHSKESLKKMSESQKKRTDYKPMTEEQKKKISETRKKRMAEGKIGKPWNTGKTKDTDERLKKMGDDISKSMKGRKNPEHSKFMKENNPMKNPEYRRRKSEGQIGEKNGNWKDDGLTYNYIHTYMRKIKPKPNACEQCNTITERLDCHNKDKKYTKDPDDWEYLCLKCHGKTKKFKGQQADVIICDEADDIDKWDWRKCIRCGTSLKKEKNGLYYHVCGCSDLKLAVLS